MGRLRVKVEYVNRFVDRYGKERIYLRLPHTKAVSLPGPFLSDEMMAAYYREKEKVKLKVARTAGEKGTFRRLLADYYGSPTFLKSELRTQSITRSILERFAVEHGHRMVAGMTTAHVERIVGALSETPGAANNLRKRLRALLNFAIKHKWRSDNPVTGVDKFKEGTWHTWTEDEVRRFEAHWPIGSRERTAFALALYTGQRRSDVAAMTWADYDDAAGIIHVAQEKGGMEANDEKLEIPVHPALRDVLAAWPRRHEVILATGPNRGTSSNGLGNIMTDANRAAGLPPRCVMHGLRKAAARRLAEAGCSTHQIKAVTGHKTLKQVEGYTVKAAQRGLARQAIDRLENDPAHKLSTNQPEKRV
jgi:integrase